MRKFWGYLLLLFLSASILESWLYHFWFSEVMAPMMEFQLWLFRKLGVLLESSAIRLYGEEGGILEYLLPVPLFMLAIHGGILFFGWIARHAAADTAAAAKAKWHGARAPSAAKVVRLDHHRQRRRNRG
jgi:hypothetical protein